MNGAKPKLDLINYDPSKDYLISPGKLAMWSKHNKNVLFIGETGVGKTAIVLSYFEQAGLRCKYFSAPTLDPYIDIIGVPREHRDENGDTFLEFIQKREFAQDEIDVVFIDELNRARPEVRNAVMEFVQMKSINGRKYNSLRMIWAAINPYDEEGEYDVDRLDPAMMGRFPIKCYVDNRPCPAFFEAVFGDHIAHTAIGWWKDSLTENRRKLVPPRTLFDAVEWHLLGGDVSDVLPREVNSTEFKDILQADPIEVQIAGFVGRNDRLGAEKFLKNPNNLFRAAEVIESNESFMDFMLPLVREEVLSDWAKASNNILVHIVKNINVGTYRNLIDNYLKFQPDLKPFIKKAWVGTPFAQDSVYRNLTQQIIDDVNIECNQFYTAKPQETVNYTFTERMVSIKVKTNGFNFKSDKERESVWSVMLKYIPENLTEEDALRGIEVMDELAKGNTSFFAQYDEAMGIFNTFSAILYFNFGYSSEDIWEKCRNLEDSHRSLRGARHDKGMFLK